MSVSGRVEFSGSKVTQEPTTGTLFPRCASARTVADACEGIVDDLWEHGGLPSVYFLVDGRLRCQAARGYFQVVDGFRPGTGVIGRVVASGEAAIIDDLASAPHFIAAIPGLNAEACVPVTVRGQVVGAVNVESRGALPDGIADLLGRAATLLGAVIESAGGMPPVPLAQRLARIVVSLTSLTEVEPIRARAVEGAIELSGMTSSSLSQLAADGSWTVLRALGPLAETLECWTDEDHRVIASWVKAGTSSHFPGGGEVPAGYEFLLRADVRAIAVQPMVVGGRVTGLLTTADLRPIPHDFTVGAALELLAAQTAASLATATAITELNRRVLQDPLTGLFNAAAFTGDMQAAAESSRSQVTDTACLLIDVDHFKAVNDTYGHPAGDRLLRALAAELDTELRGADTVYRIGGDEFAVLASAQTEHEVAAIAERLLSAARRVRATISVGAVLLDRANPHATRLTADRALYEAKAAGRDRARTAHFEQETAGDTVDR